MADPLPTAAEGGRSLDPPPNSPDAPYPILMKPVLMKSCVKSDMNPNFGQTSTGAISTSSIHPVFQSPKPSFKDVASSLSFNQNRTLNHLFGQPPPLPGTAVMQKDGCDVISFDAAVTNLLAEPLKWALIGKFSHDLPSSHTTGLFFSNIRLVGKLNLKWLSRRKVLITLDNEHDYAMIWTKSIWQVSGCPMRVMKWTPIFDLTSECPIVPIWISLPNLPVHLFDKRALFFIANQLVRPVMVDGPTANRSKASLARICVEIDLVAPLKHEIVLDINGHCLNQSVVYEELPKYCVHCKHIGHAEEACFVKSSELKLEYDELQVEKKRKIRGKDNWVWVANSPIQTLTVLQPVLENSGVESHKSIDVVVVEDVGDTDEEGEFVESPKKNNMQLISLPFSGVVDLAAQPAENKFPAEDGVAVVVRGDKVDASRPDVDTAFVNLDPPTQHQVPPVLHQQDDKLKWKFKRMLTRSLSKDYAQYERQGLWVLEQEVKLSKFDQKEKKRSQRRSQHSNGIIWTDPEYAH